MSVLMSDRDTAKLYVQFKFNSDLNISARISWSISERNRVIIRCENPRLRLTFLNLIIYSCSFFKQYLNLIYSEASIRGKVQVAA